MENFLRNHTAESNNISMTSMGKGFMEKYGIQGVQREFWKLYYESVKNGENYSLIETQKNNDFSHIYVDLDFEYHSDGITPEYEDYLIVVEAFQIPMKELYYVRDPENLLYAFCYPRIHATRNTN